MASLKCVFPAAPDGPPLDMQLEALTPHSINITWKVKSLYMAPFLARLCVWT